MREKCAMRVIKRYANGTPTMIDDVAQKFSSSIGSSLETFKVEMILKKVDVTEKFSSKTLITE